uniref:SHSP domain-containing protein n=1 Tax=Dracunculus medinensis TaxID=318479 RepID=A0A0N4UPV0_DRAME
LFASQTVLRSFTKKPIKWRQKFSVEIDASQFHPSELSVNIRENELIVEGKHEERNDENGTIQRHFIRKYEIPSDVQMDTIESNLSDHGVLSINARKVPSDIRRIPIKPSPPSNDNQKLDIQ